MAMVCCTGKSQIPWKFLCSLLDQVNCFGTSVHPFTSHNCCSRDLKPHNLLMDRKTNTLKIADLGLARAFTLPIKKYTHEVSITLRYMQGLFGNAYNCVEKDIYSWIIIVGFIEDYPTWTLE